MHHKAAEWINNAQALLICAGAGMSVDSGLPDFRGNEGFWRAYPPYAKKGLGFVDMANPSWFHNDPEFAWGFYGHRLELYRQTAPHKGFSILKKWGEKMEAGTFVFTSNVDGHFQKVGFSEENILECHGSIHHLQCLEECGQSIFEADSVAISIDEETMRARPPFPNALTAMPWLDPISSCSEMGDGTPRGRRSNQPIIKIGSPPSPKENSS